MMKEEMYLSCLPETLIELLTPEDEETLEQLKQLLGDLPTDYSLEGKDGRVVTAVLKQSDLPRIRSQLWSYMAWILGRGHQLNLTALTDATNMYERHILDSLSLLPLIHNALREQKGVLVDVGTGAGLPGLILAIAKPTLQVVLNDSLNKRLKFINEVVAELGLTNALTVHARAEDLGKDEDHREQADIVVARAVAGLPVLAEYCLPLVKNGGFWLAPKTLNEDPASMHKALQLLGGGVPDIWLPQSSIEGQTDHCVFSVVKEHKTPTRYPRKAGTPLKKPL